jgi:hypothetical protein
MKNVVSFSLWGADTKYTDGAIWAAENVERYYPGWICRFYHDDTVPQRVIDRLGDLGAEVKMMGKTTDVLGLYWRFNPICDDPEVGRFIVRDTDSKFNEREVFMVKQWVDSDKDFHIIRDNRSHNVSMMGGMWGAKAGAVKDYDYRLSLWFASLSPNDNPRGRFFGTDQMFLHCYIWPIALRSHVAHVLANEPGLKITGNEIEVPAPADGHFVGMPI